MDARSKDLESVSKALERFLKVSTDGATVHQVSQRLEIHLTGTQAYIPSYTKQVMDAHHGGPVIAVHTKSDPENQQVFIFPAKDPTNRNARKLRTGETMGPAYFAFGVPLRALKLKFPVSRKVILPMTILETPDHGTVYWISLADIENEPRKIDPEAAAIRRSERQVAASSSN